MGMDNPVLIYLLAVAGNFVPVLPILLLLGPAERYLRRFRTMDRFFNWLFRAHRQPQRCDQEIREPGADPLRGHPRAR